MKYDQEGCIYSLGVILVTLLAFVVLALLLALPVMWLWNWLMPDLFHLGTITWLQAWGLNVLCSFLFKGNYITSNK